jgi:beta-lactamase regulating signal transducer with metallopeptidase domain/biopolymer transport protein ExbD
MIIYLIYSTVSLAILILFYYLVLAKEKMYHINRYFLLFSLIFSLTIPLIPVGIGENLLPNSGWFQGAETVTAPPLNFNEAEQPAAGEPTPVINQEQNLFSSGFLSRIALSVYFIVAAVLFIRLLRIIHTIQLKADRNAKRRFDRYEIVLLNEDVVPHTFLGSIFVNKGRYEKGEIGDEILLHELAHARQKHSLDVLFVEILKILYWFNPILWMYKKAILTNHEYLADEAVLSKGIEIPAYQKILFQTMLNQPLHGLSNNMSYSLTKKRLQMMTKPTSKFNYVLKTFTLIPLFVVMGLFLGCEPALKDQTEKEIPGQELTIALTESELIRLNGEEIHISELENYLSALPYEPSQINIQAHINMQMGVMWDLQQIIRRTGTYRINYSTPDDENISGSLDLSGSLELSGSLSEITELFIKAATAYMETDPNNTDQQTLQDQYDLVTDLSEEIRKAMPDTIITPPPPPMPPSPEKRLQETQEREPQPDLSEQDPPVPPILPRNILNILVSEQGLILINKEPADRGEISELVKRFIDNEGKDPDLSESPQKAIISMKTDRQTPYDIYNAVLDSLMAAYHELRDQASIRRFGVSFEVLDENSDQRKEIVQLYPIRMSIAEPDAAQ